MSRTLTAIENWLDVDEALAREDFPDSQVLQDRMRIAMARWPLAAKQPLDWARRLIAQDKLQEARRVLVRGRRFFPLSDRLRKKIEGIDDQLYRKQQRASRQSLRRADAPPVAR